MPEVNLTDWNNFLTSHINAHILQTGEWGELKSAFSWKAVRVVDRDCGAQILFRSLALGFTIAYIPKGPVIGDASWNFGDKLLSDVHSLWSNIDRACNARHAIFLKVEPDLWEGTPSYAQISFFPGFTLSQHSIQPRRTIVVDLRGCEDNILAHMKQKCRYNIRLAKKKGVTVRAWDDIQAFHHMMLVTSERDAFGVHSIEYYQRVYNLLHPVKNVELLVAEYEGRPLAALMVMVRRKRAWYFYGASTDEERNLMPTYLLQWEAMRWAKAHGAEEYDLWGVPDEEEALLEAQFESRHDGLWGVYRFKRGFNGKVKRAASAADKVYNPLLYQICRAFLR